MYQSVKRAVVQLGQQGRYLLPQRGQALASRAEDASVLDHCVAVDQKIAEGNDPAGVRDACREFGIELGQLVEGFADDFELALDRRGYERRLRIAVEVEPFDEHVDRCCCLGDVP